MMNKWIGPFFICILAGCRSGSKEGDPDSSFFPVSSFLHSQVAMVDSSLNSILKVVTVNGVSDSSFIPKEEFRNNAQDFLSLPDLSSPDLKEDYTETELFDQELKRVVFNYTPKEADASVRRQEVIIEPDAASGDRVESIYVEQVQSGGDSSVQKRLTWQVDSHFQVVTIVQKENVPEKVQVLRLIWKAEQPSL
jgi:hypothetical protein